MRGYEQVPWTDEERQQLRRLHDNGMSQGLIAKAMGRSKNSVHRQMANMGLVRSERNSAVVRHVTPGHAVHRAPRTTLPPLPSLRETS
jgi:IS30 family transposase